MKKPIIVISPQNKPMEKPFDSVYNYSNNFNFSAILRNGGIPVMPSFLNEKEALELMENADGLFLTGGADINPALYGENKLEVCGEVEDKRDLSDYALLKASLKLKKPILCVCRGFQIANVFFGGTLYQDIPSQLKSFVKHSDYENYNNECSHKIIIEKNTPIYNLIGEKEIFVNSLHHQAVKKLASNFKAMAYAEDKIIESRYLLDDYQWLRAYQWHPEMIDSIYGNKIIKDFISESYLEK